MSTDPRPRRGLLAVAVVTVAVLAAGTLAFAANLSVDSQDLGAQSTSFTVPTTTTTQPAGPDVYYLTSSGFPSAGSRNYQMSFTEPTSFTSVEVSQDSGGIGQTDDTKHATWRHTPSGGLALVGKSIKLDVWLAHESNNEDIGLRAWVYHCATGTGNNSSGCVIIGGPQDVSWSDSDSSRWRVASFDFGTAGIDVPDGRQLRVKVVAHDDVSEDDPRVGFNGKPPVSQRAAGQPDVASRLLVGP